MQTSSLKHVHQGPAFDFYQLNREEVIKILSSSTPGSGPLSHLENEWETLNGKNIPGVRKVYAREIYDGRQAIRMEYIPGITWKEFLARKNSGIDSFLGIALDLADKLRFLHRSGIIHNRLNPEHILLTRRKPEAVLIGLGCCTRITDGRHQGKISLKDFKNSELLYIAPEQTGRTDQEISETTDLYSLGVVLYELLTGQPPFPVMEPQELIHAHIAKDPTQAHLVRADVPLSISRIIEKLLKKIPAERYLSTEDLIPDLEACRALWKKNGFIDDELILKPQETEQFNFSQNIVGRTDDLEALESIFQRVGNGKPEFVLIKGKSGVGKTVFGKSLKGKVLEASGFFLEGKYDEYHQGIPYSGLTQCLREFVNILLTKDDKELTYWKERLGEGIGPLAGVLINIVPELGWIFKDYDKIQNVEGPEATNRLSFAVRQFIRTVAHKDHPLVFLIDDIQWSDLDSLNLIENILMDPRVSNLLLIGTFREDALPEGHPIAEKLAALQGTIEGSSALQLQNLREKDVDEMLRTVFIGPIVQEKQLVKLLYNLTNGNAFHLTQLLTSMVKDRFLRFDVRNDQWRWNSENIEKYNLSGDLEELISLRIKGINPDVMKMLSLAACIGNKFDNAVLNDLSSSSASSGYLDEAVSEGLIVKVEKRGSSKVKTYQFAHDRIREMAYELLTESRRADLHLQIGGLYLKKFRDDELEDKIFDIATQFNLGKDRLRTSGDIQHAASLNLKAGQKAEATGAFRPALNYLKEGINLLGENGWNENYDLCLDLYGNAAEMASLTGDFEKLKEYSLATRTHAKKILDEKKAVIANIRASMAQKKPREALTLEIKYLEKLGYKLPARGNKLYALLGLIMLEMRMKRKNSGILSSLPRTTRPQEVAALQVLGYGLITAYFVEPDLLPVMISGMIGISLRHGNAPESAAGYMGYGFILSGYLGSYDRGYDFGNLATRILEDSRREELLYVQVFQSNIFLKHWKEPIPEIIANLDKCYVKLLNLGVFESAAFAIHSFLYFSFFQGMDLNYLRKRCDAIIAIVSTLNQPTTLQRIQMYHQAILNLLGESDVPYKLQGAAYDEDKMIPLHYRDEISIAIHNIHFLKAYMAFLFNQYDLARDEITKVKAYSESAASSFFVPLFEFLSALIKSAFPSGRKSIRQHLKKLKKYANSAPSNYLRYYTLVKAEYSRLSQKYNEARVLYDDAIYQAREAGSLPDEALGWELAGRFYQQIGRDDKASTCFQYAYDGHLRWGGKAKAEQIITLYGKTMKLAPTISPEQHAAGIHIAETFDLLSMVKSLQALSTILDMERLLEKMMDILIENAGAERGILILQKNEEWDILAERNINSDQVRVFKGQKLEGQDAGEGYSMLPSGIVHYVIRTRRMVVINDVRRDVQFRDIPYLKIRKPKSLLCMPLMNHNNLIGVVYLENTLTTGAFTQRIKEGLALISQQMAISLENALLYEDLEEKVLQNQNLVTKLQSKVEEQEKTLKVFSQFVPAPVVKKTLESKTELNMFNGEQREVVVMFCDIRDFTSISEELEPASVVELLNEFYAMMTEIIQKHGGTVTSFIGDEVMAAFGVPVPTKGNELSAVNCAIEMVESIKVLNDIYKNKFNRSIRVGIGINSGSVVAGILGSKAKLAYSITGDTVNTAKRIESLTKELNNGILISEKVYMKSTKIIEARAWDPIFVKGKKEKLTVYEIIGRRS